MTKEKKTLKQILGARGARKAQRILESEYQKYLVNCLRTGDRNAMQFEEWIKDIVLKNPYLESIKQILIF